MALASSARPIEGAVATLGVYVWDYSEMEMFGLFWDVASTFPPSAPILQRLERFTELDRDELVSAVGNAGFTRVESQEVTVSMVSLKLFSYRSANLDSLLGSQYVC